jgi:hypothetical protein
VKKIEYMLSEAADLLGCHRSTIGRQVKLLGMGRKIGARVVMLSTSEINTLRKIITPGVVGKKSNKGK